MDIKSILEFVRRTNPNITEKQLVEVLASSYNVSALCLMSHNLK